MFNLSPLSDLVRIAPLGSTHCPVGKSTDKQVTSCFYDELISGRTFSIGLDELEAVQTNLKTAVEDGLRPSEFHLGLSLPPRNVPSDGGA